MRTLLKVLSIINIVFGALAVICGIMVAAFGSSDMLNTLGLNSSNLGSQDAAVAASTIGAVLGVVIIIAGILTIMIGIFGILGAKGRNGMLMAVIVLSIISAVSTLISLFGAFTIALLIGLVLDILLIVAAFSVRKENKQQI